MNPKQKETKIIATVHASVLLDRKQLMMQCYIVSHVKKVISRVR